MTPPEINKSGGVLVHRFPHPPLAPPTPTIGEGGEIILIVVCWAALPPNKPLFYVSSPELAPKEGVGNHVTQIPKD